MVLKVSGLTAKWSPKFNIGYTDTETVKADFDQMTLKEVKKWANRTVHWYKLGGYIVLQSSEDNYHIEFNRQVTWTENVKIMAWISLLSNHLMLQKWFLMQCIKEASTIRIGPKGEKPIPRIVERYGRQGDQIEAFLQDRKLSKKIIQHLHRFQGLSLR